MSRQRIGRTRRNRRYHATLCRPVVCSEDKKLIDLRKWMSENRVRNMSRCQYLKLVPAIFTETGRGLMTKKAIYPGETIISIPGNLLITPDYLLQSDIGPKIKSWIPKLTSQQAVSIFLIWEKWKGKSSFWFHYIQVLPVQYSTPSYYTDGEINLLPGHLQTRAKRQREKVRQTYEDVVKYCELHWKEFLAVVTYKDYLWAWFTVNTRAVYYKTDNLSRFYKEDNNHIALAPFLDLLNHNSSAQIHAGYNKVTECYEIKTEDKYKKYDQVFISYGSHDNCFLLMEYGFIIPQNPHDVVMFEYDEVINMAKEINVPFLKQKEDILNANDVQSNLVCNTEGVLWKLQLAVRILAMDWDEMKESKWKRAMLNESVISDRNEMVAKAILKMLLQSSMARNTSVFQKFPADLSSLTYHEQLAYGIHEIEKDILQTTLQTL